MTDDWNMSVVNLVHFNQKDLRRNAYSAANCMDRVSAAFALLTTHFSLLEVHTRGEALPFSPLRKIT